MHKTDYFFFNNFNTLEVIIGIKPPPATANPIFRKWVQFPLGSIP